jgi:hypothetical protein
MADDSNKRDNRSRIKMNKKREVRYWRQKFGCTKGEVAAQLRRWAIHLVRYAVKFLELGHMGRPD